MTRFSAGALGSGFRRIGLAGPPASAYAPQRQGNIDEDKSRDPSGEWGHCRRPRLLVYSTAKGPLTLEVYRRYLRLPEEAAAERGTRLVSAAMTRRRA